MPVEAGNRPTISARVDSPSYSGGMHFELTGMAQSVEPA
jgi:hypothetical protein